MLKRKKLLAALLAGTMMLSLASCGKKANQKQNSQAPPPAMPANRAYPAPGRLGPDDADGNAEGPTTAHQEVA